MSYVVTKFFHWVGSAVHFTALERAAQYCHLSLGYCHKMQQLEYWESYIAVHGLWKTRPTLATMQCTSMCAHDVAQSRIRQQAINVVPYFLGCMKMARGW